MKKTFCLLTAFAVSFGCLAMNVDAVEMETESKTCSLVIERASGRFSMDIGKQFTATADKSFPLEIGETVTINASYPPGLQAWTSV